MRVAVLSYPMLFQTAGGLKMKVGRTVDALVRRGIDARLVDPVREKLRDFDLVHVFAPYNGNNRVIEQAKSDGLPSSSRPSSARRSAAGMACARAS